MMERPNNVLAENETQLIGEIVSAMQNLPTPALDRTLTYIRGINTGLALAETEKVS